jgi:lactoylglutathione lyase
MDSEFQQLGRRLVGRWTSEATHPEVPGTVIAGSCEFEWLAGEQFLVFRSHSDHPDFPDAISILGDTEGLRMHYFDSRGVHRVYAVTASVDGWTAAMDRRSPTGSFASGDAPFSQRMTYALGQADQTMSGKGELSHDDVNWDDDLQIAYSRVEQATAAKSVVEELFRRQRAGDDHGFDELVAEDMVNHAARPQGRHGLRQILDNIRHDLGDGDLEGHHLVAEGDLVAHHVTVHGAHRASTMPLLAGIEPAGVAVEWKFIHIWRVADGKVVEHWACRDDLGLLDQLGAWPPDHGR